MPKADAQSGALSISPLADRVVIKPAAKQEEVSASGIIVHDSSSERDKPSKGTVVAVGPGKYENGQLTPMEVKVGDRVLFSSSIYGSPDEIKLDGEKYLIVTEAQILAVIKK
jgi:chaperonin GroES